MRGVIDPFLSVPSYFFILNEKMHYPSLILYQRRMDMESVKVEDVLICEGVKSDLFK